MSIDSFSEASNNKEQYKPISFDVAASTLANEKHPERNEDSAFYYKNEKLVLAGIFDGMGGYDDGDVNSKIARQNTIDHLKKIPTNIKSDEAAIVLREILIDTNDVLKKMANGKQGGTTASLMVICDSDVDINKKVAVIGNVGDSRVYRIRGENLQQITIDDDSILGDDEKARKIQKRLSEIKSESELNDEEMFFFKSRNVISQFLGGINQKVRPRIFKVDVESGDNFLITSDGISDNLTSNEIKSVFVENKNEDSQMMAEKLIKMASLRSKEERNEFNIRPKKDDITGIVIKT
jgi:protein phosphatase